MPTCLHTNRACINQYELVRKYRCDDCGSVMMCACDRDVGEGALAHQLQRGTDYVTKARVPVTGGFEKGLCDECRGLPAPCFPMAEIPGRTSKIDRYYSREIAFLGFRNEMAWAREEGHMSLVAARAARPDLHSVMRAAARSEIKALHAEHPKYNYNDDSQAEVIKRNGVKVVELRATYVATPGRTVRLALGDDLVGVEQYAAAHYSKLGYRAMDCESEPFHALFGVMLWSLVQDPTDPLCQSSFFGRRDGSETNGHTDMVHCLLPSDFGSKGYGVRRSEAIDAYMAELGELSDDLLWVFDHRVEDSASLRNYLWAHRTTAVERARRLVEVLPARVVLTILRYLVESYWDRFCGWPDLLLHRPDDFMFTEVKSSKDKLSNDQKRWINDNTQHLRMPFCITKVHRIHTVDPGEWERDRASRNGGG